MHSPWQKGYLDSDCQRWSPRAEDGLLLAAEGQAEVEGQEGAPPKPGPPCKVKGQLKGEACYRLSWRIRFRQLPPSSFPTCRRSSKSSRADSQPSTPPRLCLVLPKAEEVGPPPRVKPEPLADPAPTLSGAISLLVSQGMDGLVDLALSRGSGKREKLQPAPSNYRFFRNPPHPCLQAWRRCLARDAWKRLDVSLPPRVRRLEELGFTMWGLAHVADCLTEGDVALRPSTGRFGAELFGLLTQSIHRPPFTATGGWGPTFVLKSSLCATALQYLKEVDLTQSRRLESLGSAKSSASTATAPDPVLDPGSARPRRPRLRKKPRDCRPASPSTSATASLIPESPLLPGLGGSSVRSFGPTQRAGFLRSTLHLPRLLPDRPCVRSGNLFPLPVPCPGAFSHFPAELGSRTRRRVMHRRLLRITCMALNFLHANFAPILLPLLQRPPARAQLRLIDHVGRHLKAFGASVGDCTLPDTGRRNPQLVACLRELSARVTQLAPSGFDRYSMLAGHTVPVDNSAQPALEPHRSLDVARLKISGLGAFDPVPPVNTSCAIGARARQP